MNGSDDLRLQGHCKPYQMQNYKPLIYQPPHRRFSSVEKEERIVADSFVGKCGHRGTSKKDRKDDWGSLQGLSWLERDKDDAEEGVNSDKNGRERVQKLASAKKFIDSTLDLAVAAHKGFSEEIVVLLTASF